MSSVNDFWVRLFLACGRFSVMATLLGLVSNRMVSNSKRQPLFGKTTSAALFGRGGSQPLT
jgi:hypothetical protein